VSATLYAIADCDDRAAAQPGRERRGLRMVGDGPPFAVLGGQPQPAEDGVAALLAHERVVADLMAEHAVLPARYGTSIDEEAALTLVREHRDALTAALARVRGAVELSVRVRLIAPTTPEGLSPGTAYLRGRLDARRRAAEVDAALAPLTGLARASAEPPAGAPGDGIRRAYLVERAKVDDFVTAVAEIDAPHEGFELVCTGPWPPYSFSGGWQ
jgi:hypothetical protein